MYFLFPQSFYSYWMPDTKVKNMVLRCWNRKHMMVNQERRMP